MKKTDLYSLVKTVSQGSVLCMLRDEDTVLASIVIIWIVNWFRRLEGGEIIGVSENGNSPYDLSC